MAVGAKKAQVFEPVVLVVPIDVVEFEWDGYALPDLEPAALALRIEQSFAQEALFELEGLDRRGIVQIRAEWLPGREHASPRPASALEMRSVDAEAGQSTAKHFVIATVRCDVEPFENLPR